MAKRLAGACLEKIKMPAAVIGRGRGWYMLREYRMLDSEGKVCDGGEMGWALQQQRVIVGAKSNAYHPLNSLALAPFVRPSGRSRLL